MKARLRERLECGFDVEPRAPIMRMSRHCIAQELQGLSESARGARAGRAREEKVHLRILRIGLTSALEPFLCLFVSLACVRAIASVFERGEVGGGPGDHLLVERGRLGIAARRK